MTPELVLALSGKMCSGKSVLATALRKHYGFKLRGFAWSLKEDMEGLTGLRITKDNKQVYRPLLQAYGEAMRQLWGDDYWVRRLLTFVQEHGYTRFVVDDVRHHSEVAGLRAYAPDKLILVRLEVSEAVQAQRHMLLYGRVQTQAERAHISETALDGWSGFDVCIDTDTLSGPEVLRQVIAAVNQVLDQRGAGAAA